MVSQNCFRSIVVAVCGLAVGVGCGSPAKQPPCVDKSKPALELCEKKADTLQRQLNDLKIKLAQALANPGTIKVDPQLLQLDGNNGKPAVVLREGTLKQSQVVTVLSLGKAGLQACYNRALKRNTALHHSKLTLTVAFKVKPSGTPTAISVSPNRDAKMNDCMIKSIRRWKFPAFEGQPVGVETPVTLRPKG